MKNILRIHLDAKWGHVTEKSESKVLSLSSSMFTQTRDSLQVLHRKCSIKTWAVQNTFFAVKHQTATVCVLKMKKFLLRMQKKMLFLLCKPTKLYTGGNIVSLARMLWVVTSVLC